jgi:hypothetical protein
MTSGYPRVNCCIDGCHRGTTRIKPLQPGHYDIESGGQPEWICSVHWRLVPRSWKRRRSLFWRRLRKAWPESWPGPAGEERRRLFTLERLLRKMWSRMKRHAESPLSSVAEEASLEDVERAFGIA